MRPFKSAAIAAFVFFTFGGAAGAATTTLDFDDLSRPGAGFHLLPDRTLEYGDYLFSSTNADAPFLIWGKDDSRNADLGGGTFTHKWDITALTISRLDGTAFDLISLDIADLTNSGARHGIQFDFYFEDGRYESAGLTTDAFAGLETYLAGKSRLTRFTMTAPPRHWTQIDNLVLDGGISGAVPEPATWAMMIGGFGLVGGAMRRRAKQAPRFA